MCDVCADFLNLLVSYDSRINLNEFTQPILHKHEVEIAFGYIQTWPQRQCMCCYRDLKNYERFNLIVQSMICLTVCQLKNIQNLLATATTTTTTTTTTETNNNEPVDGGDIGSQQSNEKKLKVADDGKDKLLEKERSKMRKDRTKCRSDKSEVGRDDVLDAFDDDDDNWTLNEIGKLLIIISKVFLLNFPLYVAYKHGVHSRLDDISAQEVQSLSVFCDLHDSEIPAFLLRNVTLFCTTGGFAAMSACFNLATLPVTTAHAITAAISNLKLWLNYRSCVQLFVPLRIKILQYMCSLADADLRSPATRSMADFMWAAIKDPLDTQVAFDMDGLALAFKYFTSTTLTMRLAGMAQINAHINLFNDICTSETVAEVEMVGQKLADWLTENQIVTHLFGPNLHVEVIKQSHIVLNFLAVENQITEEHINLIWQAAQLKHCSKPIYDILPSLVKNLAQQPALHLYALLCRLDPREHTEQSIYIASALTKLIWSRDGARQQMLEMQQQSLAGQAQLSRQMAAVQAGSLIAPSIGGSMIGPLLNAVQANVGDVGGSSSENSISIDGSNSDDDHPDEDSSDEVVEKSPMQLDIGSDSGPTPCKQARHKTCCDDSTDSSKLDELGNEDDIECEKHRSDPKLPRNINRLLVSAGIHASSSDDDLVDAENFVVRKKLRTRKRAKLLQQTRFIAKQAIEAISDGDSHSNEADERNVSITRSRTTENSDDCSETQLQLALSSAIGDLPLAADNPYRIGAIADNHLMDLLSGAENDGSYSSVLSNKSEKNLADFDDNESPCEEELAQLAAANNCLTADTVFARQSLTIGEHYLQAKQMVAAAKNASQKDLDNQQSGPLFRMSDLCSPGKTLLWDLLMDDKIGQLGESLALEAEKALGTLLCFNTDKFIRTKFIEGCLQNLAANRSVIVSLRLLPKLFASFQQFRASDTHKVTIWSERQHKMMFHFFNNIKHYATVRQSGGSSGQIINQNGDLMYTHLTQVQVRLQFLTSVFSAMGSPESFQLTFEQVDSLWEWLAHDTECSDCLFAWLQCHAKGSDQHALGIDALQHLYLKKLPELRPESISMVALGLFQQLCSLARLTAATASDNTTLDSVGMSHLWKIALRATNTDVSLAATQYINSYYMGQQLKLEREFVSHCMDHLMQAANDLDTHGSKRENALLYVQRALMLLNTHLDTFRRRYAYHLRRWALEGKSFGSHSALRNDAIGPPIRIVLQPGGLPDKSVLHLHASDLVADLKAEIGKWWEQLQGGGGGGSSNPSKSTGGQAPVLGLLLSEGPLRIITQGQEITAEYDERSLADVGFKDNQMVYVSLGGRGGRRRDANDHPSLQPPPPKECLPTVLLLQPKYFEELFKLMQRLGDVGALDSTPTTSYGGNLQPNTKAQLLSRRVWDILAMLPTNPDLLMRFKSLSVRDADPVPDSIETKRKQDIQDLLDPNNLQKFMYALHIVESLAKSTYIGCCNQMPTSVKSLKNKRSPKQKETAPQPSTSFAEPVVEQPERKSDSNDEAMKSTIDPGSGSILKPKWTDAFIKYGGLRHLFDIFLSGMLQPENQNIEDCNEWRTDCLASLLRILCLLGLKEMKPEDTLLTVPGLNGPMMELMVAKPTLKRLASILNDAGLPTNPHKFRTGFWGRAQVIHFAMNLMVCLVHSSEPARQLLWSDSVICGWLQQFILDDPEPAVRREACAGLYRICLGNNVSCHSLMAPLLAKLISFLPQAEQMTAQHSNFTFVTEDAKEPYGPACRDYFWLLGRLVDTLSPDFVRQSLDEPQSATINIETLCRQVADSILKRDYNESRYLAQDDGLVGLLNLLANLIKYDPPYKYSDDAQSLIAKVFDCLFDLPSADSRHKPKCKSQSARAAAYDLLVELCRNAPKNFLILHEKLMNQHRSGPHSPYPWDYWPRDDGRSECGYVGLTNLGATCYMASCLQHLFMMPQAREAILSVGPTAAQKHGTTLHELQRMFAYLMESERKAYNPRSFCRVYQMDHQPLNTAEQKDMAEFFIDLVSKLEEMTIDLKTLIKRLFCGTLSNNVVSLDCGHVSRTLEEFYTVRCQVADMRNLHESLDEVTVKDTLEGDNMYTCSQCGRKVRAEKRACFKKLPQILCFNTMRYTFNMITMLKEKVNTHFSFPMRLDMSGYVEKTLMPQQYLDSKRRKRVTQSSCSSSIGDVDEKEIDERDLIEQNVDDKGATSLIDCEDVIDEFSEHLEYDLVGVTVHTGTADGGHYYSFIKERNQVTSNGQPDRWFLFNDAEVKIFDPSQIGTECFGGEMISKTYDSVTEKYLDFSFEKTHSAYMLFYERRATQIDSVSGEIVAVKQQPEQPSCSRTISPTTVHQSHESIADPIVSNQIPIGLSKNNPPDKLLDNRPEKCDIDVKIDCKEMKLVELPESELDLSLPKSVMNLTGDAPGQIVSFVGSHTTKSVKKLLSKELEDWIWQDNRHFLQDRNIFEHTYFSFMWQICGNIPQTLLMHADMTCVAAQLSVSFFIETFIHAKEKPTMVLWVELLTKQFNASQEACEWFLSHMSIEPWWPVQVLIQCPNQMVRQMFQRIVIHVIQRLRSTHYQSYLQCEPDDDTETIGNGSCVTRFIKSLIILMEHGAKAHLRHLSEFFGLMYEFSRMGDEETLFLLKINVIRSVADFYLGNKTQDCLDTSSDNDDNSSDEASLSVEKARPASLDKMIALVASLVERSRGADLRLHLSSRDYNAIAGGKGFPFLYQQIKDNINPNQTRHLIHALCRFDERLANQIIAMLFTSVTKHTELCGPFFKLLTLLTESSAGPSGLPCFSQLVLQRVWSAAEYCPQSALEWLALQAPRNKIAHAWILQSAESWVENFLLAHNNTRVRNAAAYLLVSLVPSQTFRANYRNASMKLPLHAPQRELSGDAQIILHTILNLLLRLLRAARTYTDITVHGTAKLTAFFSLLSYCMISKQEKLMLNPFIRNLWELFHPRLSEPSVPTHHNKQALLAFWHHATSDCVENAQLVANCTEITRNIAFNYILADHEDSEIVAYNRAMLPAYYGLLRLCCQQSRTLTRQLAAHQNLQWAFKNITPHPTQYTLAVDELFRLMTLFAARQSDATEQEQREIATFRRTTMSAYLSGLDARVSWGTLIAALRILIDNDDDRLFVVFNGGVAMCFEALHTLHSMYHEATACHVSGDILELLAELRLLINTLRVSGREQKKRPPNGTLKGLSEAARRLATLLNTFNPPEMRNLALDILKEFIRNANIEVTNVLMPLLTNAHIQSQTNPTPVGPLGPYFPRRGAANPWHATSKGHLRPPRPMVQMTIPHSQLIQRDIDPDYDRALDAFYRPYHDFLDVMLRMAVNTTQLNESLVNLSCLAGIEGAALHFNLFPKFWVGIFNNKSTNKYVELLVNNTYLVDYVDTVLRDERISLNDPIILRFMELYLPKTASKIHVGRLLESICKLISTKENYQDLCGDLLTINVICESCIVPDNVKKQLQVCIKAIYVRFKEEFLQAEESPPKRRKLSDTSEKEITETVEPSTSNQPIDQSIEKLDLTKSKSIVATTSVQPLATDVAIALTKTTTQPTPAGESSDPPAKKSPTPMDDSNGSVGAKPSSTTGHVDLGTEKKVDSDDMVKERLTEQKFLKIIESTVQSIVKNLNFEQLMLHHKNHSPEVAAQ